MALKSQARMENMKQEVTGGREKVRQEDGRVERVGWIIGEEFAKQLAGKTAGSCRLGTGL